MALRKDDVLVTLKTAAAIAVVVAFPPLVAVFFSPLAAGLLLVIGAIAAGWTPSGRRALTQLSAFAKISFLETHRRRVLYAAIPLSWTPGLLAYFLSSADGTLTGRALLVQHWFSVGAVAVGSVVATLIAAQSIPDEFHSKRVFNTLTKPASRWMLPIGKWLGLQVWLIVFFLSGWLATMLTAGLVAFEKTPSDPETGEPLYYLDGALNDVVYSSRADMPLVYLGLNPTTLKNVVGGKTTVFPVFLRHLNAYVVQFALLIVSDPATVKGLAVRISFPSAGGAVRDGQGAFDSSGRAVVLMDAMPDHDWSSDLNDIHYFHISVFDPTRPNERFVIPWLTASVAHTVPATPEDASAWKMYSAVSGSSARAFADFLSTDGRSTAISDWANFVKLNAPDSSSLESIDVDSFMAYLPARQAVKDTRACWLINDSVLNAFRPDERLVFRARLIASHGRLSSYPISCRLEPVTDLPGETLLSVTPSLSATGVIRYPELESHVTFPVKSREEFLFVFDRTRTGAPTDAPFVLSAWPQDGFNALRFSPETGVAAAPLAGYWTLNLLSAFILLYLEAATLSALIMFWGGAVSFPVAVTFGFVMALGGQVSGAIVHIADEQYVDRQHLERTRQRTIETRKRDLRTARAREPNLRATIQSKASILPNGIADLRKTEDGERLVREYQALTALIDAYPSPDDTAVADSDFLDAREKEAYPSFPPAQRQYYRALKAISSSPPDLRRYHPGDDIRRHRHIPASRLLDAFIMMLWRQSGILGGIGLLLYCRREIASGL